MISRSALAAAALVVLSACTTAVPATPSPQPTPTLQPPFTPSAPSPTAAATPTLPPATPATAAPSTPAPVSPTVAPTAGSSGYLLLFSDDMSDPTSGWGTGETAGGTATYADETLDLTPTQAGAYIWSRRQLEGSWDALRVTGTLLPAPEATGYLGLLCGGPDDDLIGAVVSTDGGWVFARIRDGSVEVLDSDVQAGLAVGTAEPILYSLDCAAHPEGLVELDLRVNGVDAASLDVQDAHTTLDRVAAYAEAEEGPFSARFDDVTVIASDDPDGLPSQTSPAALALLQHIPEDYRPGCFETPVSGAEPGALAAVTCALPQDVGVDLAEYVQFESVGAMTTAYQQRVAMHGEGEDQSCQEGPAEGSYTIDGEEAGRLLCATHIVGARYDWTDDRLNILTNLTDFDGDYAALYAAWLEAGPNP